MSEVFAGLPVTDHAAAEPWYERLFGEPPFMRPHDTESAWQLEEHAWVYVVEDASAPAAGCSPSSSTTSTRSSPGSPSAA